MLTPLILSHKLDKNLFKGHFLYWKKINASQITYLQS